MSWLSGYIFATHDKLKYCTSITVNELWLDQIKTEIASHNLTYDYVFFCFPRPRFSNYKRSWACSEVCSSSSPCSCHSVSLQVSTYQDLVAISLTSLLVIPVCSTKSSYYVRKYIGLWGRLRIFSFLEALAALAYPYVYLTSIVTDVLASI